MKGLWAAICLIAWSTLIAAPAIGGVKAVDPLVKLDDLISGVGVELVESLDLSGQVLAASKSLLQEMAPSLIPLLSDLSHVRIWRLRAEEDKLQTFIEALDRGLITTRWKAVVRWLGEEGRERARIYAFEREGAITGLLILKAQENREGSWDIWIVNLVGRIDLSKIGDLAAFIKDERRAVKMIPRSFVFKAPPATAMSFPRGGIWMAQLLASESYIGVEIRDLTPELAGELKAPESGVVVTKVYIGSPADFAGLEENDVIIEFDGEKVEKVGDFIRLVSKKKPGDEATLTVVRGGEELELKVKIGERPGDRSRLLLKLIGPGGSIVTIDTPSSVYFVDDELVRISLDLSRACVMGLVFKRGSNRDLISDIFGNPLLCLGSKRFELRSGWELKERKVDMKGRRFHFELSHLLGHKLEISGRWNEGGVEITYAFDLPDEVRVNNNLDLRGGGRAFWAAPTDEGVKTGELILKSGPRRGYLPGTVMGVKYFKPAENWIAFWTERFDEVYGFTFKGDYRFSIESGAMLDLEVKIPKGRSSITFHVVRGKPGKPYEAIRAAALGEKGR
ncbi:hypothetical protein DRP77_10635 [Candidatus Poribacteria bacterium]|nr:MAG: hypothetical protein DRP77_10635 [Candidatus Poribacteria bacterium]